jgi:hypothetical protein
MIQFAGPKAHLPLDVNAFGSENLGHNFSINLNIIELPEIASSQF